MERPSGADAAVQCGCWSVVAEAVLARPGDYTVFLLQMDLIYSAFLPSTLQEMHESISSL